MLGSSVLCLRDCKSKECLNQYNLTRRPSKLESFYQHFATHDTMHISVSYQLSVHTLSPGFTHLRPRLHSDGERRRVPQEDSHSISNLCACRHKAHVSRVCYREPAASHRRRHLLNEGVYRIVIVNYEKVFEGFLRILAPFRSIDCCHGSSEGLFRVLDDGFRGLRGLTASIQVVDQQCSSDRFFDVIIDKGPVAFYTLSSRIEPSVECLRSQNVGSLGDFMFAYGLLAWVILWWQSPRVRNSSPSTLNI